MYALVFSALLEEAGVSKAGGAGVSEVGGAGVSEAGGCSTYCTFGAGLCSGLCCLGVSYFGYSPCVGAKRDVEEDPEAEEGVDNAEDPTPTAGSDSSQLRFGWKALFAAVVAGYLYFGRVFLVDVFQERKTSCTSHLIVVRLLSSRAYHC